jgi:hypothetical protein
MVTFGGLREPSSTLKPQTLKEYEQTCDKYKE